jgi:hypothetical protein
MGSSHRRRELRALWGTGRFLQSGKKGAARHRWREACSRGIRVPKKAVYTAEKSGGSKPRRKRGLRIGKARSRVGKTRRSPDVRQPLPREISTRQVAKFTQVDFWVSRRSDFIERIRPWVKEDYQYVHRDGPGSISRDVGRRNNNGLKNRHLNFDHKLYRSHRTQYEALLRKARLVKVCRPVFTRWLVFLDTHFRYSPPGVLPATQYLEDAILFSRDSVFDHLKPGKKTPGRQVLSANLKGRRGSGSSTKKSSGSSSPSGSRQSR